MYSGTSPQQYLEKGHLWNEDTLLCSFVFEDYSTSGTRTPYLCTKVSRPYSNDVTERATAILSGKMVTVYTTIHANINILSTHLNVLEGSCFVNWISVYRIQWCISDHW